MTQPDFLGADFSVARPTEAGAVGDLAFVVRAQNRERVVGARFGAGVRLAKHLRPRRHHGSDAEGLAAGLQGVPDAHHAAFGEQHMLGPRRLRGEADRDLEVGGGAPSRPVEREAGDDLVETTALAEPDQAPFIIRGAVDLRVGVKGLDFHRAGLAEKDHGAVVDVGADPLAVVPDGDAAAAGRVADLVAVVALSMVLVVAAPAREIVGIPGVDDGTGDPLRPDVDAAGLGAGAKGGAVDAVGALVVFPGEIVLTLGQEAGVGARSAVVGEQLLRLRKQRGGLGRCRRAESAQDLGSGHQHGSGPVELGGMGVQFCRRVADTLHVADESLGGDPSQERVPAAFDDRPVALSLEEAVVDAPGEAVDEKRAAARLADIDLGGVEQARAPEPVRLLCRRHRGRHFLEEIGVDLSRGPVCGERLDQKRQAGEDPAVAAAPEDLFPVGRLTGDEPRIPVEELLRRIEEHLERVAVFSVEKVEIAGIARGLGEAREGGGRHVERVAPGPAIREAYPSLFRRRAKDERLLDRPGEDFVELLLEREETLFFGGVCQIDIEPGVADGVVVREVGVHVRVPAFVAGHPRGLDAETNDGGEVTWISGHLAQVHEPVVERRDDPVAQVRPVRVFQLPIGGALQRLHDMDGVQRPGQGLRRGCRRGEGDAGRQGCDPSDEGSEDGHG